MKPISATSLGIKPSEATGLLKMPWFGSQDEWTRWSVIKIAVANMIHRGGLKDWKRKASFGMSYKPRLVNAKTGAVREARLVLSAVNLKDAHREIERCAYL